MSGKKTTHKKQGKRYHLELSLTAILLWSLGLIFLLGWIFTLGVLAGRGLLPGGNQTLTELKTQIARIQEMISKEKSEDLEQLKGLSKHPEFEFYDALAVKEEWAESKSEKPTQTAQEPARKQVKSEPSASQGEYVIQVASLDNEKDGTRLVKRLTQRGYSAYYYKVYIKGKPYYRVRCGTFDTRKAALDIKNRLMEKEGLKGFIIKVK
ncbi:MAG: SPOR domain-containing protein [Desulfatiglandaceae bacterium]